jgi:osomolarity two-component system sensor histidine kinase SLN1
VKNDVALSSIRKQNAYISGPLYNRYDNTYLMSMTFPVMGNTTIFINSAQLSGYISIVFKTGSIRAIINDTTGLDNHGMMYLLGAVNSTEYNTTFVQTLLPHTNADYLEYSVPPYKDVPVYSIAMREQEPGSVIKSHLFNRESRSVGYALCMVFSSLWVVVITEPHSTVYAPIYRLRNITLVSGFSVLAFCTIVIIICVHFGVQPIYRLKQAAEQTTLSFHSSGDDQSDYDSNRQSDSAGVNINADKMLPESPKPHKMASLKSKIMAVLLWKKVMTRKSSAEDNVVPKELPSSVSFSNLNGSSHPSDSPATVVNRSSGNSNASTNDEHELTVLNPSSHQQPRGLQADLTPTSERQHTLALNKLASAIHEQNTNDLSAIANNTFTTNNNNTHSSNTNHDLQRRMLVPTRVKILEYRFFTDELVSLQYSFNRMADELEKQYTHLEDMVRERTKELEAARVQAEKANEAKSLFIANITHELRTPLNGILGMTAVSLTENDPNKVRRSLKVISKSGMLLLNLLNDLLTFSKNQIGHMEVDEKEFILSDILGQVQTMYTEKASTKGIIIEYTILPPGAKRFVLFGDCERIIHVLLNLVSNSVKFAPDNSKIHVRIQWIADASTNDSIVNSDNGPDSSAVISNRAILNSNLTSEHNSPAFLAEPGVQIEHESSLHDLSLLSVSTNKIHSNKTNSTDSLALVSTSSDNGKSSSIFNDKKRSIYNLPELLPCTLRIEVEDSGPGVDPNTCEQLFEPFVQGDQALSRKHGGAGLGLSICKQLTSLLGGTIELHNKSSNGTGLIVTADFPVKQTRIIEGNYTVDVGRKTSSGAVSRNNSIRSTTATSNNAATRERKSSIISVVTPMVNFTSSFSHQQTQSLQAPLQVAKSKPSTVTSYFEPRPSPSKPQMQSSNSGKPLSTIGTNGSGLSDEIKAHILIAEDNIINQEIMKRMLALEGIKDVELAVNGEQAIAKVEEAIRKGVHYDVVFMDVQMPRMDGLQATQIIRSQLGYTYPIVALTAFADEENAAQCISAGMDSFMEKPIIKNSLREVLQRYCPPGSLIHDNDDVTTPSTAFESFLVGTPITPV